MENDVLRRIAYEAFPNNTSDREKALQALQRAFRIWQGEAVLQQGPHVPWWGRLFRRPTQKLALLEQRIDAVQASQAACYKVTQELVERTAGYEIARKLLERAERQLVDLDARIGSLACRHQHLADSLLRRSPGRGRGRKKK